MTVRTAKITDRIFWLFQQSLGNKPPTLTLTENILGNSWLAVCLQCLPTASLQTEIEIGSGWEEPSMDQYQCRGKL